MLALALHALSPLAAPAASAGPAGLHDFCTSTPFAPAPDGTPQGGHCALCVQPAAINSSAVALPVFSFAFEIHSFKARPAYVRPLQRASSRAPPAGA
jgi:hypothetical protein